MLILGLHNGYHDASACLFDEYRLVAAVSLERLTRRKGDGRGLVPEAAIDEVLAIASATRADVDAVAGSRSAWPVDHYRHLRGARWLEKQARILLDRRKPKDMTSELRRAGLTDAGAIFDGAAFLAASGFAKARGFHFYNHHLAHALPTLFYTEWPEAVLYTADGRGDNVHASARDFDGARIETLWGDDAWLLPEPRADSLGLLYGYCTQALGYRINRHEGKLTGLAAFGETVLHDAMAAHFSVDAEGRVDSDFGTAAALGAFVREIAAEARPADVAASVQRTLETFILESLRRVLARRPRRHLGLAGGVFANVRLNRRIAEELDVEEIFVFPPMGDEGLPVGGVLDFLLRRDGLPRWLGRRRRLDDVYLGRDYTGAIDAELGRRAEFRKVSGEPVADAARRLAAGEIGAIYTGRMEFGPRALGARSILASPADADVNRDLNKRLDRTDFMPFAPVIAETRAAEVFEIGRASAYAARFMTVTCGVRPAWRDRIPAVVHVDFSARPQVIRRESNPLYADILAGFERESGLPVLVNTSFNVHEEPIVNRPEECAQALADGRIDFVVTTEGVWRRA